MPRSTLIYQPLKLTRWAYGFVRDWRACFKEIISAVIIYAMTCGLVVLWSAFQPFDPPLPDWANSEAPGSETALDGVWEGVWGGGEGDVMSAYGRAQRAVVALRRSGPESYSFFYAVGTVPTALGGSKDLVGSNGAVSFQGMASSLPSDPLSVAITHDGSRILLAASEDGGTGFAVYDGVGGQSIAIFHPRGTQAPSGFQRLSWDLPYRYVVVFTHLLPIAFNFVISSFRLYLLITGCFALLLWVWRPRWVRDRQIQPRQPKLKSLQREMVQNCIAIVLTGIFASFILGLSQMGMSKVYVDVQGMGISYLVFSFVFAFVAHDTWFYWIHRAYHTRFLYNRVHKFHHLSLTPNPITTLSLSSSETLLGAMFLPAFICLVPIQRDVLLLWIYVSFTRQVMGHIGHEVFPNYLTNSPLRFLISVTHHDMHHEHFTCNYGLYFTWWDTLMRTNHPDYVKKFQQVTSHGVGQRSSK